MICRAVLVHLALTGAALAEGDPGADLRRAAAQLREAGAALASVDDSQDRIPVLTDVVRAYETGLGALRDGIRTARLREDDLIAALQDETRRSGAVISALTTMGRTPQATLLLHPAGPEATARAGMLMGDVTPALLGEVEALRRDLSEIADLRAVQDTAVDDLESGLAEWRAARTRLAATIEARDGRPRRTMEPAAADRLAGTAASLSELADRLAVRPSDGPDAGLPAFDAARGNLELPVPGDLSRGFGAAGPAGVAQPGWTVAAMAGTLVTAPWPATIRFRGPLLDNGNVMILEPQAGYLMVFAGLDALYGNVGEVVAAGTPVGTVPGGTEAMAGIRADPGEASRHEIYIEVRRNGDAEDPADWFRPDQG